jgi:hypothetical protein
MLVGTHLSTQVSKGEAQESHASFLTEHKASSSGGRSWQQKW